MIVKLCEICGAEYDARHSKQRYCLECRDEAKRRRQRISHSARFPMPVPSVDYVRKDIKEAKDGTKLVIVSDLHYPFIDERTWRAVRHFIDDFQPNVMAWNGDIGDFYNISFFDKNPARGFALKDEVRELRNFLYQHRQRWPDTEHYYLKGNHEERLETYIKKNPELEGLISLEAILHLKQMEFTVLPWGGILNYLGFSITHGNKVSSLPNGTARMHAVPPGGIGGSGVVAHSHRRGMWVWTDMHGTHSFYESGCLSRLDPDYVRGTPNWQWGFMAATVYRQKLHLDQVAIYDDGFAVQGEFYKR